MPKTKIALLDQIRQAQIAFRVPDKAFVYSTGNGNALRWLYQPTFRAAAGQDRSSGRLGQRQIALHVGQDAVETVVDASSGLLQAEANDGFGSSSGGSTASRERPKSARLARCRASQRRSLHPSDSGHSKLDGSRSPFDQLAEIIDAVGDRIDAICDGGISRGTHVLKALSLGAKACSGGRFYLYALAAAGQVGVERALQNLHNEIERDVKLMGCRSINELTRENLRFR